MTLTLGVLVRDSVSWGTHGSRRCDASNWKKVAQGVGAYKHALEVVAGGRCVQNVPAGRCLRVDVTGRWVKMHFLIDFEGQS